MSYPSGLLRHRVTIQNKVVTTTFGDTTGYVDVKTVWADVTWAKGAKSLREGALDAYDTVMIRMRWNGIVTCDSHLKTGGNVYQIQSLHDDYQTNTIQITATELVNQQVTIVEPTPAPTPTPTSTPEPSGND
jgi:SPP1 family predicted phage head-tail adaptor